MKELLGHFINHYCGIINCHNYLTPYCCPYKFTHPIAWGITSTDATFDQSEPSVSESGERLRPPLGHCNEEGTRASLRLIDGGRVLKP